MDALTNETPQPPADWTVPASATPPPGSAIPTNGLAVAALVLGVLALSLAVNVVLFLLAVPVGLAALTTGVLGVGRARESGVGKGQAIAGAVTGGLATALGLVWIAGAATVLTSFSPFTVPADTGEATAGRERAAASACAEAVDRRVLEGERRAGDYVFSAVEVCSDSFGDFAFSATVRNDGTSGAPVDLQVQAVGGGGLLGAGTATATIAPGSSARVDFVSFDDYRSTWTDVVVGAG